ncbi:Rieske (2Fe-2S) protein [Actinoplanes sp. ATCC 53533]|uniref:Rieske (2Fe-2S) protein n=1 Tax=Actinoplanes sp. ATCC 53533 TaxID=1288362 RepID=UPI000F7B9BE1|nr:Rieske (2Fe-2S) protein [Actinoplanes sp. ATCC 53533]RSM72090.1 Rieske (2Fe-2S) protein [Actinoplanes sp. ATCC 53533]
MTDVQTRPEAENATAQPACGGAGSSRRVVLAGASALGVGCLLAACGTDTAGAGSNGASGGDFSNDPAPAGSKGADTGSTTDSGSGDTGSGGGSALALVADVPEGGGVIKGDYVITQPAAGTFKAFSKVCTHQGCDVTEVDAGAITCKCHNSKFSIEDGAPTSGPAKKPLTETKVKVDGDNIVAA